MGCIAKFNKAMLLIFTFLRIPQKLENILGHFVLHDRFGLDESLNQVG